MPARVRGRCRSGRRRAGHAGPQADRDHAKPTHNQPLDGTDTELHGHLVIVGNVRRWLTSILGSHRQPVCASICILRRRQKTAAGNEMKKVCRAGLRLPDSRTQSPESPIRGQVVSGPSRERLFDCPRGNTAGRSAWAKGVMMAALSDRLSSIFAHAKISTPTPRLLWQRSHPRLSPR